MALKIVIEDRIPFVRGVLEELEGVERVEYLPAPAITREVLADADALLTRTRCRCDAALLGGTRCRFVGTATIGTDHIDTEWCRSHGVTVANAPGCNAPAVAQYVMRSILRQHPDPAGLTLGIVGVGHVGSIVERWARGLGMRTLACDPPRAAVEGDGLFVGIDTIARESDIITFHTPLNPDTRHYFDAEMAAACRRRPMVINSARGPVTDTEALTEALGRGLVSAVAIDCWENEPAISRRLLEMAQVATPHIAGYSREGKIRATAMAVAALCRHFGLGEARLPVALPHDAPQTVTREQIMASYDIDADTAALKAHPELFEELRNSYRLRQEPYCG